ncbi:MAG: hypothetical protein QW590_02085 [Candidatus Bilamarchaeaceae archaeon]
MRSRSIGKTESIEKNHDTATVRDIANALKKALLSPEPICHQNMKLFETAEPELKKKVAMKALCSSEREVRNFGIGILKKMVGDITDDDLLKLASFLDINVPEIRAGAVEVLGAFGPNEFVRDVLLVQLEKETNEHVISSILDVLWSLEARMQNNSFEYLVKLITDDKPAVRAHTLIQIERYKDVLKEKDILSLKDALNDDKLQNKLTALRAIYIIDKPNITVPWLISLLDTNNIDEETLKTVIEILGDARGFRPAEEKLKEMYCNRKYEQFREQIRDILFDDTMRVTPRQPLKSATRID